MDDRRSKRKKKMGPIKIFLITLLTLFILSGVGLAYYMNVLVNKMGDNTGTEAKKVEKGDPVNFLLLGVDSGNYDGTENNQRSDTMMLIRYIPKEDKVYILSIPRDTKVKIKGKEQKINAAHALGGPKMAINSVEELIGVDINYYASLNYEGFKKCVDAVGGVDVVVPQNMHYKASDIQINFKKGENVHLNGDDAEKFIRWRKNNDGTGYALGDVGRAETQQVFMVKFFEKLKSAEGLTKLPTLLDTVTDYAKTNLDLSSIMNYGSEVMDVNSSNIEKNILPGEAFYDKDVKTWYYIYDESKDDGFLDKFRGNSNDDNKGTNKHLGGDLHISVYNATGTNGLAAKYQERLKKVGFTIGEIDTYKISKKKTEVRYNADESKIKDLKDHLFGVDYKEDSSLSTGEVKIILGEDAINGGILVGSTDSFDPLDGKNITDKNSKKIKILNSTSKPGLAKRYKEKLEDQGYKVQEVGNSPTEVHETQVKYKNDNTFANEVVTSLGTGYTVPANDIVEDIVIILGSDVID